MKCDKEFQSQSISIIRVPILSIVWSKYLPRLGVPVLFYILSRLGSIRQGLACYSISFHALAVSAEAWHAIILWSLAALAVSAEAWHPPTEARLGLGGLACYWSYSMSCYALAVSAEAWHAILYLVKTWQYPQASFWGLSKADSPIPTPEGLPFACWCYQGYFY